VATLDLLTGVLLGTIAVGVATAILAWRERREPGGLPLVALMIGQIWWSAFLVFDLNTTALATKVFWANVRWVGVVIIPVAWLLFALEYAGRDEYISVRSVAGLSVIPAITVFLALTGDFHDLLYVETTLVSEGGRLVLDRTGGPWYWVIAAYTYLLGLLGVLPLLQLVRSEARPFRGQSLALLVGAIVPWATNILHLVGALPVEGVDPTPVGFAVSGVALLGAIRRYRLLEVSPAPTGTARQRVFERMQAGAIVLDRHDNVVDINDSMVERLGVDRAAALGQPVAELIPAVEDLSLREGSVGHVRITGADGERTYDVAVTPITDGHGRSLGNAVTFHDVEALLHQQQRLEVLNRVLRHNIRTETNLIAGYAELIDEGEEEGIDELIKERAERIEAMGEQAREIAELFDREGQADEPVPLARIVTEAVASIRERYPDVTVDCGPIPDDVAVTAVLRPVVANVLENAAEHNTSEQPRVGVDVEPGADVVTLRVEDNGPGISRYERAVLERGTETPLEHGSGLGLWLIKWGVGFAGGRLSLEENDPSGTVVTIEVPIAGRRDAGESE